MTIAEPKVLVSGRDFYAFPRIDLKGEHIAWIEWAHPNMPWDKSELWVGYIGENGYAVDFCFHIIKSQVYPLCCKASLFLIPLCKGIYVYGNSATFR